MVTFTTCSIDMAHLSHVQNYVFNMIRTKQHDTLQVRDLLMWLCFAKVTAQLS